MRQRLYNRFIKPLASDSELAEREIVLNYLLVGIFLFSLVTVAASFIHPIISDRPFHPERVLQNVATTLFVVGLYVLARYKHRYRLAATILVLLVMMFACLVSLSWGLFNPHGLLLLSLSVVMAGVLIGARYSVYVAGALAVFMFFVQQGETNGYLHPDLSWQRNLPFPADVIVFTAILFMIALVSWLFNRQMERSLLRARRSEKALKRQKELLEIKVEKRAQELEAAQLEKMQELYRFAELGRLSTALFHDLANHLSTVSLDIEGLTAKDQSDIMRRIRQNVGHIDTIVRRVRQQIRGKSAIEVFSVMDEINEVLRILAPTARQANVTVTVERGASVKPQLSYKGDVTRFRQIILNLICNGIEAYPAPGKRAKQAREVMLRLEREQTTLLIEVTDRGKGIAKEDLSNIFRPFYTTKGKGMGIGLFIVKQVVEQDFNGVIVLTSNEQQGTTVSVSLPKSYYARTNRR